MSHVARFLAACAIDLAAWLVIALAVCRCGG